MYRSALVFSVVLAAAFAAVIIGKLEEKPEKFKNVEGCYIKEIDNVIPVGENVSVPPQSGCYRYFCSTTQLILHTCGTVAAEPPLKVVYDTTKSYPDCCGKVADGSAAN